MGSLNWIAVVILQSLLLTATACQSPLEPRQPEQPRQQAEMPYTTETVAEQLNVPWDMDIAPDGRLFFTERPGTVRMIRDGKLAAEPVISFGAPFMSKGEGGLLGLALDPEFADNHYIYVYHTYEQSGRTENRVLRLKERDGKATVDRVLIDGIPGAANHNGGRVKFGPDGYLYVTAGDRYEPSLAQDESSLGGKILRIAKDGSIPPDNPIPGSPVYSMGHRNPQGLAWHPDTKKLYASEHGQSAHDELNAIEPGANYGWPLIEGDRTSQERPELKQPLLHSGENTWAPSGMTFVTQGPWRGKLLVANLRGERVMAVDLQGPKYEEAADTQTLFESLGRVRNVFEAPDGSLYIMTNNRDGRGDPQPGDDKLLRLKPAF